MCGGLKEYLSSKTGLIVINSFYVIVSLILISVAAYAKGTSIVNNLGIIGGIIACGVFLLLLALLGLFGVVRDHQKVMFCYTISLCVLFIIQFGMAIACLAVPEEERITLAHKGWTSSSNDTKQEAQTYFECCAYELPRDSDIYPSCAKIAVCCEGIDDDECCTPEEHSKCTCNTCHKDIEDSLKKGLNIAGGVGMFFAFTQLLGIIFSSRFQQITCPCGSRYS